MMTTYTKLADGEQARIAVYSDHRPARLKEARRFNAHYSTSQSSVDAEPRRSGFGNDMP